MGEGSFRDQAAEVLADIIRRARIIPDAYGMYQRIVEDGTVYFLSKLPLPRLVEIVAHQTCLDAHLGAEARLVELALKIPTLHKLGQMLARNRHVDPRVRAWLVGLENGAYGTDPVGICRMIEDRLGSDSRRFQIRIEKTLLSEASVGGVVACRWVDPETGAEAQGVFKALKPGVVARLEEEMTALDALADYFEDRRQIYSFGEFRFRALFEDVKAALREELNLPGEQANLSRAYEFYKKNKQVRVPKVAPFSSRYFTAMSRMDGAKVTDALTEREDRKQAADTIFRAIICAPLFSAEEAPLFHGDPHAGNIYSAKGPAAGDLRIALLDWSQAGSLAKVWRVNILKFIQGVISGDEKTICRAITALSAEPLEDATTDRISRAVEKVISLGEYQVAPLMKKTFIMLERLSFQGIRFQKDLLLFRKTFFTLDGLLNDLDPEFNMDHAVMSYIRDLLIGELPRRLAALLMPISDSPEKYRSMLSNKDLQMLLICQAMELIKRNADMVREFLEKHAGLISGMLCLPKMLSSRTAKVLLGLYYLYRMSGTAEEAQ